MVNRITKEGIDLASGISNYGNYARLQRLFARARQGEMLKIAFIGGSITQGSLASCAACCFAARVFAWWQETFPKASFVYINAGIGGTTSQFGCARVYSDVLCYEPDFVAVKFSVNDEDSPFFLETYESLIRRILSDPCDPAVFIIHQVCYRNGLNAQAQHAKVARHYQIPSVSMQSSVYPKIRDGGISERGISPDGLHPNDNGHRLVSEVIIYFLQKILEESGPVNCSAARGCGQHDIHSLPRPLTAVSYLSAVRICNDRQPSVLDGFWIDTRPRQGLWDVFKHGWTAARAGATIVFEVKASEIAVQYRKSVNGPALSAKAVIDSDEDAAVLLDGNFDEDWGDCLYLETLLYHGSNQKHTVAVTVLPMAKGQESAIPFYLASLLVSSPDYA